MSPFPRLRTLPRQAVSALVLAVSVLVPVAWGSAEEPTRLGPPFESGHASCTPEPDCTAVAEPSTGLLHATRLVAGPVTSGGWAEAYLVTTFTVDRPLE